MRDEIIELTTELVKFQTFSENKEEIRKCIDFIEDYFRDTPLLVLRFEKNDKPSLFISFRDTTEPEVILHGHVDVVGNGNDQFEVSFSEDGNKLYGRGAIDMKSQVAAMMVLFKELASEKRKPNIALMIVSDEESGGWDGSEHILNEGYTAKFFISGEVSDLGIGNLAKGILRFDLESRGKPAHAAMPWRGENAIEFLMQEFQKIKMLFEDKPDDNSWCSTVNLSLICGGTTINQVPDTCKISLDIRFLPEEDPQKIVTQIQNICPELEITNVKVSPPVSTDPTNKYVKSLSKCIRELTGENPKFTRQHSSSDARHFSQRGIPSIVFGPKGHGEHSHDEYVEVESLMLFYEILRKFVTSI